MMRLGLALALNTVGRAADGGVPANTAVPTITASGDAFVGAALTFHAGTWTGSPSLTRTWEKSNDGFVSDINTLGAWADNDSPTIDASMIGYALRLKEHDSVSGLDNYSTPTNLIVTRTVFVDAINGRDDSVVTNDSQHPAKTTTAALDRLHSLGGTDPVALAFKENYGDVDDSFNRLDGLLGNGLLCKSSSDTQRTIGNMSFGSSANALLTVDNLTINSLTKGPPGPYSAGTITGARSAAINTLTLTSGFDGGAGESGSAGYTGNGNTGGTGQPGDGGHLNGYDGAPGESVNGNGGNGGSGNPGTSAWASVELLGDLTVYNIQGYGFNGGAGGDGGAGGTVTGGIGGAGGDAYDDGISAANGGNGGNGGDAFANGGNGGDGGEGGNGTIVYKETSVTVVTSDLTGGDPGAGGSGGGHGSATPGVGGTGGFGVNSGSPGSSGASGAFSETPGSNGSGGMPGNNGSIQSI